jgi:hypothetical protein
MPPIVAIWLAVVFSGGLLGCAPRSRMTRDPFRPQPAGRAQPPLGPTSSGPWQDNQRDVSRSRSTSPATDPDFPREANNSATRESTSPSYVGSGSSESQLNQKQPARAAQDAKTSNPATGAQPNGPTATTAAPSHVTTGDYQSIRQRLDRAGARIDSLETDPETGMFLFRCVVPYQNNPELARVFAARDKDELKAMLAVTQEVEKWVAQGGPNAANR